MRALVLLLLLLWTLAGPTTAGAGAEVLVIRVEGVVTRGTTLHVQDAIDEANARGVPLVIELDTPGGLVDATLEIHKAIVQAEVPVLAFVGPRGAYAASAGTFLLLMGHPSGMAPETQIGSAQPIEVGAGGGARNATDKVENFLVERLRAIAERAGRNETLAVRFITENLNMDEDQALATGMVDVVAPDLRSFVDAVDGRDAIVGDGTVILHTADARLVRLEPGLLARTVEIIGNPQIAFVLFLVGLYALIFGLAAPGTFVPETIGALLLLLGLIGLGLFDTSTAGFLLLLLGALLLVAEIFAPTHGVLASVGIAALVLAALFLVDEPLLPASFLRQFIVVGLVSAGLSAGVIVGAVTLALRARRRPVLGDVVGAEAVAVTDLAPEGQVQLRGEIWRARTQGPEVPMGARVLVMAREGLTLLVRPVAAAAPGDATGRT